MDNNGKENKGTIHIPKMSLSITNIEIDEETYYNGVVKVIVDKKALLGKNEEKGLFEITVPEELNYNEMFSPY